MFTGSSVKTTQEMTTLVLSEVFKNLKVSKNVDNLTFPYFVTFPEYFELIFVIISEKHLICHLLDLRKTTLETSEDAPRLFTLKLECGILEDFLIYKIHSFLIGPFLFGFSPPFLLSLSEDLLAKIFQFLSVADLGRAACSCRVFRNLKLNNELLKK